MRTAERLRRSRRIAAGQDELFAIVSAAPTGSRGDLDSAQQRGRAARCELIEQLWTELVQAGETMCPICGGQMSVIDGGAGQALTGGCCAGCGSYLA